jgi:hypothetical protein
MRHRRLLTRAAVIVALVILAGVPAAAASAKPSSSAGKSSHRVPRSFLKGAQKMFPSVAPQGAGAAKGLSTNGRKSFSTNSGIQGVDGILNWTEAAPDAPGFSFWDTVGTPPTTNSTTNINAPIVPVFVSLKNADGSQAFLINPMKDVQPELHSPVFQRASYSSSPIPTQFTDAVQRAEYFGREAKNWHTELAPSVKAPLTLNVPWGSWFVGLNQDGSVAFTLIDETAFLNGMFPPTAPVDNSTVLGQAELNGDITTQDLSTFLFDNVFLYSGTTDNCCVLGFHTLDLEPGDAGNGNRLRTYAMDYESWISPGLFGDAFTDITALSHEIAEAYNDPFVGLAGDNQTPWWLAPNGVCQNNRETGDVIEGLTDATFPMTMHGFTYHPQNEALLSYFEFQQPSSAIGGAYSYPDTTVLSGPSAPQNPGCS